MGSSLDEVDRTLLKYLQENARITNAELARRVDLSPPGLQSGCVSWKKRASSTGMPPF
ncbi:MAG: Lrp/AsnC family transcriptional regulator [Chloroflexi bacterium]|nr:Lrp/AsnC family transcriptional regulator [Chloroflexota bacterium]